MLWKDFNLKQLLQPLTLSALFFVGVTLGLPSLHAAKVLTDEKATDFIAMGDMGSRLPAQYEVARALAKEYAEKPFGFVLFLGDNIYPKGDVKQFGEASFTKPYAPLLKAGVPFYVSLGNHDVDFGFRDDAIKFYKMPSAYYSFHKGPVDFFAIDTNAFDVKQQHWLDKELGKAKNPWKIVFGHHPMYSSGKHGPNLNLENLLEPILVKHHVDLYLTGHEHDYERFAPIKGVTNIISGGGGASLRPFNEPYLKESLVRQSVHHFLRLSATPDELSVIALDKNLNAFDHVELKK